MNRAPTGKSLPITVFSQGPIIAGPRLPDRQTARAAIPQPKIVFDLTL
jgi:hypothetical protein